MNEVIHPKHEVGKVSTGPSKTAKLESVYRRRDIHLCRSADAWYRRGRDVNEGEQPLKRVVTKKRRDQAVVLDEDLGEDHEANEGTALYAEYQTSLYIPPPVVDGQIPKNAYGNLDVYVPTMIPAGAVHIRHPLAAEAALVLGVDYTDAVTGFEFKGRQGTAVVDGVVVSADTTDAMIHVIEGLESQASDAAEEARSRIILGVWKRWLTALRVRERVHQQYGDNEESQTVAAGDDDEEDETYEGDDADHGGGFMHEAAEPGQPSAKQSATDTEAALAKLKPTEQLLPPEVIHQDVVVVRSPNKLPTSAVLEDGKRQKGSSLARADYEDGGGGGFVPEEADDIEGGGFLPEDNDAGGGFIREAEDDHKGNPVPGMDDGEVGGGFLPEESTTTIQTTERPKDSPTLDKPRATPANDAAAEHASPADPTVADEPDPSARAAARTALAGEGTGSIQPPSDIEAKSASPPAAESRPQNDPDAETPQSETSLLSHDPDEEDAEPEWLLNSLGEL